MKKMEDSESFESAEVSPRIRRGRVNSFELYEITDNELNLLSQGAPGSIELTFGIALLSSSFSFIVSLMTSSMEQIVQIITICITVIFFIAGSYLMLVWRRSKVSVADTVRKIRARIPND